MGSSSWQRDLSRRQLAEATEAALGNEQITRQRVDGLWRAIEAHTEALQAHQGMFDRGAWGRLRWLVFGK